MTTEGVILLVVLLLAASGTALGAALMITRTARVDFERHLGLVAQHAKGEARAPTRGLQVAFDWMTERLRRFFAIGAARTWGMRTPSGVLALTGAGCALLVWILLRLSLAWPLWLVVPLALLGFFIVPRLLLIREQRRADRAFMEMFADAIDMVVRMLRAGLPMSSAVRSVGTEAPWPINTVFSMIADQVEIGMAFEDALEVASRRVGLPDFRFFAVAVTLQRATGGNLAATLAILSDIIRKRRAIRLKAMAATAEVRISALVLAAVPFFTIGILLLAQPSYVAPLITDPRGNVIAGVAVALLFLAFLTMRQMMRRVTAAI
jgi:tight adherence protein B